VDKSPGHVRFVPSGSGDSPLADDQTSGEPRFADSALAMVLDEGLDGASEGIGDPAGGGDSGISRWESIV
jgi:hypothetical protein